MSKKTQIAVALAVTLPLILEEPIAFWGLLASIVPDLFQILIKRKSLTHSAVFLVLTTSLVAIINLNIAIVWCINYMLHIFLDCFTTEGVQFFYPSKKIYGVRIIESNKKDDVFIGICALAVIFILLIVGY